MGAKKDGAASEGAEGEGGAKGEDGGAAAAGGDGAEGASGDGDESKPSTLAGEPSAAAAATKQPGDEHLISPFPAELPPYPSTFRTLDVLREVEKVREARKRIRLGAEAYAPEGALIPKAGGGAQGGAKLGAALLGADGAEAKTGAAAREDQRRGVGKPSVCLFTLHDTGDRCVAVLRPTGEGSDLADAASPQSLDRLVLGGLDRHGDRLHRVVHPTVEPRRQGSAGAADRPRE